MIQRHSFIPKGTVPAPASCIVCGKSGFDAIHDATPVEQLQRIERIASAASWQERASTPNDFARFCNEILCAIDIDSLM